MKDLAKIWTDSREGFPRGRPNPHHILEFSFKNQRFGDDLGGLLGRAVQLLVKSLICEGKMKDLTKIWTDSRETIQILANP